MSEKSKGSPLEMLKSIVVIALLVGGAWIYMGVPGISQQLGISIAFAVWLFALLFFFFVLARGKWARQYLSDSFKEVKKVVWPSRQETMKTTVFVIIFSVVFTAFLYGIDNLIAFLFNMLLVKG